MKIKWLGTASLLVESGGTRLFIDPYLHLTNPRLPALCKEETDSAQAILITHPHFDHFADIDAFTSEGRETYVPACAFSVAEKNGYDSSHFRLAEAGEEYRIGSFTVRPRLSRHCKFDAATVLGVFFSPRTWLNFSKGVNIIRATKRHKIDERGILSYEIDDGDKRIVVLGSAGLGDGEQPKGCDLLVFPYQGRTRMHRYLMKFLDAFEPKAVMLDHFDDAFPPFTHTVSAKKFLPSLHKKRPDVRGIVPTVQEWLEI